MGAGPPSVSCCPHSRLLLSGQFPAAPSPPCLTSCPAPDCGLLTGKFQCQPCQPVQIRPLGSVLSFGPGVRGFGLGWF